MRITYDPRVDALYIGFSDRAPSGSTDLEEGVTVDLDDEGHVLGLEVLDAAKRFGAEAIATVHVEQILASEAETIQLEQ